MKLLVIGNVAYDIIGTASFLPQTNQATLIKDKKIEPFFGGCAGNVAVTASMLGVNTSIFSAVGNDFKQSDYLKHLQKNNVDTSSLCYSQVSTARSFIFTDDSENQQIYYYPGASSELGKYSVDFNDVDYVHFAAGEISVYPSLMKKAWENNCSISFDPGQELFHRPLDKEINRCLPYVSHLFLNHHEAMFLLDAMRKESVRELIGEQTEIVVVSRGNEGSAIYLEGETIDVPAFSPKIVKDPTGAGDSHRGAFLAAVLNGYDYWMAGKIASVVSSFVIEKRGAQTNIPTRDEINDRLSIE